jgi:hypothetical protein
LLKFKTILPLAPQIAGFVKEPMVRVGDGGTALIVVKVAGELQPPVLFIITL